MNNWRQMDQGMSLPLSGGSMEGRLPLQARYLVVDDDPATLNLMREFLGNQGASVRTAGDGHEALEKLKDGAFDIVLSDRHMPGMDGHMLLQQIRLNYHELDVIIMTGAATVKTAVEAMRLGAADYIEKPLDYQAALSIFRRVEDHRRVRQERDRLRAEVALRELSQVITTNLHMSDLPVRIAELIKRVFQVDNLTIHYRFPGSEEDGLLWRSHPGPASEELDEIEQLMTVEAATQGRILERRHGRHLVACLPLLVDAQHRGSILLYRDPGAAVFAAQQLELLQVMASQVNIALENAHLFQMTNRQMRGTQKLAEIGRRLNGSLDMEQTLGEIHQGIRAFVACDFTLIVMLDRSLDQLHVDISGTRKPNPQLEDLLLERVRQRVGRIQDLEFNYEEIEHHVRGEESGVEVSEHARYLSWVPITDSVGCFGLLGVVKLIGRDFRNREIQNFMLLSSSASSALQNSLLFTSMRRQNVETVQVLSKAIDEKDHYTHGHSAQVGGIAIKLAKRLGIHSTEELEEIHLGGLMHDLGKIGIRDAVLNKPGKLNSAEYAHIQTHPLVGAEILRRAPHLHRLVPFVRLHHERWDGSGYPDGIAGEEIPQKVRILTLADTFHAMASDRIYRSGMTIDSILVFLKEQSGKMFDPQLVDLFLECWEEGVINEQDIKLEPVPIQQTG